MPRKGKKATDTAKTSNTCGKCTVAETEVTVSPQEERNDPPTPPIELVAEHPNFPTMRYQNFHCVVVANAYAPGRRPPPLHFIQPWPCLSEALTIWSTNVIVQSP
ncbi:hypothetical protein DPMN_008567 [Dreissena polymorpha]|uniref:Uncharacterized protein n=1 Tax=Dreissena polymorpha TaxID=45954 RepID=A0A9D4MZI6_DREPO|nr:hypothetical protein DPMN_008567 [Dreissena polymorpha]